MREVRFRRQRSTALLASAAVTALLLVNPVPVAADSLDGTGAGPQIEWTGGGVTRAVPPTNVAIFQDSDPWSYSTIRDILTSYTIPYTVYGTSDIGVVDLTPYDKVIISSAQPLPLYTAVSANVAWFEAWVTGGGTLEFHGATYWSNDWSSLSMPGGLTIAPQDGTNGTDLLTVVDAGHPLASDPNTLDSTLIDSWSYSSHSYFTGAASAFAEVIQDDVSAQPVMLEMPMDSGCIITTLMSLEWGANSIPYPDPLENMLLRTCAGNRFDVLLAYADDGATTMATNLGAYDDIGTVDVFDVRSVTPDLATLTAYDAVVAWPNYEYGDATAMGDVLADYVDAGGTVILSGFNFYPSTQIGGRIAGPAYSPYVTGPDNHYAYASLGATTPGCITEGITAATDFYRDMVTIQGSPIMWAFWDDGEEYVAQIPGVRVVAVNSYVGDYRDSSGQVDEVIHNAIVCTAGQGSTADEMYATDDTLDSLYDLEPATGATSLIGACGQNISYSGMAYDSTNAVMYVSDVWTGSSYGLGSVNLGTGVVTVIGDHVSTVDIWALAYNPFIDVLYGADYIGGGALTTIDRATGVSTPIGSWGTASEVCGLAYNQDTGVLYASDNSNLYTVNEATGAATLVGAHSLAFGYYCALEYNPSTGKLYVAGSGPADLHTLDMATGAATSVGPTGLSVLSGMGSVVVTGTLDGQLSFSPDLMGTDPSGFLIEATPLGGGSPYYTVTDGTGNWSMKVPDDTYDLTAYSLDWLGALHPAAVVTTGAITTLSNPTLLGGDFDDSGAVGLVDVTFVASRYSGPDLSADINRSGSVDLVDVTSTASNYGSTAPVPWP